jgi:GNAT superfamily N-acetyltransferase
MSVSTGPFERIEAISEEHDLAGFDCGDPDFNDFIKNDAVKDKLENNSVTYIGFLEDGPAAYISLVAAAYQSRLVLEKDRGDFRYNQVPAIKIARLATDLSFQNMGCGRFLMDYSVALALRIKKYIGVKLIITDALPDKVRWYLGLGFILSSSAKISVTRKNYPMYQVLPKNIEG